MREVIGTVKVTSIARDCTSVGKGHASELAFETSEKRSRDSRDRSRKCPRREKRGTKSARDLESWRSSRSSSLGENAPQGGNTDDVPEGVLGTLWVVAASFLPKYIRKNLQGWGISQPLSSSTDRSAVRPPRTSRLQSTCDLFPLIVRLLSPNARRHQSLKAQNQLTGERMLLAADTHHGRQRRLSISK